MDTTHNAPIADLTALNDPGGGLPRLIDLMAAHMAEFPARISTQLSDDYEHVAITQITGASSVQPTGLLNIARKTGFSWDAKSFTKEAGQQDRDPDGTLLSVPKDIIKWSVTVPTRAFLSAAFPDPYRNASVVDTIGAGGGRTPN